LEGCGVRDEGTGQRTSCADEVGNADEGVRGEDKGGALRGGRPVQDDETVAEGRQRVRRVPGHLGGPRVRQHACAGQSIARKPRAAD
jgi:hypothetical protein